MPPTERCNGGVWTHLFAPSDRWHVKSKTQFHLHWQPCHFGAFAAATVSREQCHSSWRNILFLFRKTLKFVSLSAPTKVLNSFSLRYGVRQILLEVVELRKHEFKWQILTTGTSSRVLCLQEYLDLVPLDSPVSSGASDSQYSSMTVSSAGSTHSVLVESPV